VPQTTRPDCAAATPKAWRKCGCRTCQESMSYYLAARLAVAKIAA
jgi:hypothetical protein